MVQDEDYRTAVFGKTERTVGWEGDGEPAMTGLLRHCVRGNPQRTDRSGLKSLSHSFTLDAVVHCWTEKQCEFMLRIIGRRLAHCGLALNLEKSRIVHCKSSHRMQPYACQQFTFLGYTFRPRKMRTGRGRSYQGFGPGVSLEATKKMLRTIKSWKLSRQTGATIGELAFRYNPILRGWANYYGHFNKTALRGVFDRFEAALARWARRKYKKLARHEGRSFKWIWRVAQRQPGLFTHWRLYGSAGGRAMGAV